MRRGVPSRRILISAILSVSYLGGRKHPISAIDSTAENLIKKGGLCLLTCLF